METWLANRFRKVGRVPVHGWSDAAIDLPAAYFNLAAEFSIATAHPNYGRRAAENFARRFKNLGTEFRGKAAKLNESAAAARKSAETSASLPQRDRWLKQAEFREGEARKHVEKAELFESYDADTLLKEFPPGEKTIRITTGPITVGSGTAGQP
jgi:hypothetical protein